MPTQSDNNTVSIIVNGKAHSAWSRYQIDSDFLVPADAWSVSLGLPEGAFPGDIKRGAPVQVMIGRDVVMIGRIDRIRRAASKRGLTLSLSGRDNMSVLVDCAAPLLTSRQIGLEEVIAQVVRPLGITKIRLNAESSIRNDKVATEPGERAWDLLHRACAGRGLWPWFSPDGTLMIGGPDYTAPPVATLILRPDGKGNNVIQLDDESSEDRSFSELTLLAQGHAHTTKSKKLGIVDVDGTSTATVSDSDDDDDDDNDDDELDMYTGTAETGLHGLKAKAYDPTVTHYRPQIIVCGDAESQEQMNYRARKAMADARLAGYDLTAVVAGHRTSDGKLWEPGQRIHVISDVHGINAVFFLMGREFVGGRQDGMRTTLRLKEDGVWIPDAFPRKKRKRRRKHKQELGIVDVG
ncbi:hypothetical protein DZA65_02934 [Dickeya dianthicola]|uniref:Phage tail protein n=1 Tax=Dickeya dianthicola TaxID=204039 RepID=A0ABX9NJU3_9GAMM|nr:tail protein [Dickeya dianthicola]AYC19812.1 hypothetical protein DZA65_02934 [Dickeya dianthicola]MBI0436452.1 phage tail protein [Dickeya dianthicola]MBI0447364.1 phage tail protein [Dickeya dianthicola]MBI0451739.1 phage tail protein [Dickeya dianthicola]MBI0456200.1 phage tail protein [Dickeya dianthicola]